MAGWENRINAYLEDVCCRSPEGWGCEMMETCACAEYKKPELTVIAFTTNHSVSACSSYSCLLGGQDASNAETISQYYFTYYDSSTSQWYILWYYEYDNSGAPNETYMNLIVSIMSAKYNSDSSFTYYQNSSYGYENGIYKNWHLAYYDGYSTIVPVQSS